MTGSQSSVTRSMSCSITRNVRPAARRALIVSTNDRTGFVAQNDARAAHHHARQLVRLLLTPGKHVRPRPREMRELHGLEERVRTLARSVLLSAHALRGCEHARESFSRLIVGVDE